jgi:hypothetical protein
MKKAFALFSLLIGLASLHAQTKVTISGLVKTELGDEAIEYVSVVLKHLPDSAFVTGSLSDAEGRFVLSNVKSGSYLLQLESMGLEGKTQVLEVGSLSEFLDLGSIQLSEKTILTEDVVIVGEQAENAVGLE